MLVYIFLLQTICNYHFVTRLYSAKTSLCLFFVHQCILYIIKKWISYIFLDIYTQQYDVFDKTVLFSIVQEAAGEYWCKTLCV